MLVVAILAGPACAVAQGFPSRPITIYVGLPPGGISDWQARAFGNVLGKRLGQPVVVENKPGAGSALAMQAMKNAPPDGHAMMTTTNVAGMAGLFYKDIAVEIGKDFVPVTSVFWAPYVIVLNGQVPAKSMREFVQYAKANPGKLNWAAVPNNAIYLDAMYLIQKMGVDITIVPYQGAEPAHRALVAGEVQVYMAGGFFGLKEAVQRGQINVLSVLSAKPDPQFPDVPTMRSAIGLDVDLKVNYGFAMAAATPKPIVERVARELGEIALSADMSEEIRKRGYQPEALTPDEFMNAMRQEYQRAKSIADAAGIKPH